MKLTHMEKNIKSIAHSDNKNITEQLMAFKKSEEQLRILIDLIPEFVVLKDGEGRWLISNKTVLNTYKLTQYDYVEKTDLELSRISPNFK
jgi:PAS domain-containing protein